MNNLLKSGLIITIGNLLVQGLAFITLPIYTRVLSIDVFGEFNLYTSWVSMISLFIGLQLSGSLSIAKIKYTNYKHYANNILTLSNIFFLIVFLIVIILKSKLSNLIGFNEKYILIMFVQSYLSYLVGFFTTYFVQLQQMYKVFLISFFNAFFNVVISLCLIFLLDDNFYARVLGNLLPSVIISVIIFIYFYKDRDIKIYKKYLVFSLGISIPLIFHNLGHNILNQFDRIMLGKMSNLSNVALYSFGYNLGIIIQVILNSINAAWIPWYFKAKKENNQSLQYFITRYLALGLFLTLGYLTIFPDIAMLMGGARYKDSVYFISLIIISYFFVFLYTFPVNIQFYYENTKFIPFGTLLAGLLNIVLNYLLIPFLDVYGAALATVVSYFVLLLIHHVLTRKLYKYTDVRFFTYISLSAIVLIYSQIMDYFVNNLIIRWSIGILIIFIYGLYFKNDVANVLKKYKENKQS